MHVHCKDNLFFIVLPPPNTGLQFLYRSSVPLHWAYLLRQYSTHLFMNSCGLSTSHPNTCKHMSTPPCFGKCESLESLQMLYKAVPVLVSSRSNICLFVKKKLAIITFAKEVIFASIGLFVFWQHETNSCELEWWIGTIRHWNTIYPS